MKEYILKQLKKDNIDYYSKLIIAFGLLRAHDECAICSKKIKIKDYHIQMCRECRIKYMNRNSN
jgi:hypothetical protein